MQQELNFETPNVQKRIKGMLGVDFYRLFHTPLFYIFLAIAAIIPAMISATSALPDQNGQTSAALYTNVFQIIAAFRSLYVIESIGDYANMNMVFIFGGIMVSIFIGHDYSSGYVKQLFTTHPQKQDYMISKTLVCAFAMAAMCLSYLLGGLVGGLLAGYETTVQVPSLIIAIWGKMVMSLGWASLYTFLNVIFRRYFGISILSSFFFGTGILIIGVAALTQRLCLPLSFLNIFLYGASVNANLSSGMGSLFICLGVSVAWAFVYITLGTKLLAKSDVY